VIRRNVDLAEHTNYKIGGPARFFADVASTEELSAIVDEWNAKKQSLPKEEQKMFVIGGGSNVLVDDEGYRGLIILNNIKSIDEQERLKITFGSGLLVAEAVDYCIAKSLSGLEWAGGLPGTVGGAVRGNAGAFGGETKDNCLSAESMNIKTLKLSTRDSRDCRFAYRSSCFKTEEGRDEIITRATFAFKPGERLEIAKLSQEKIDYRISHQPLDYPSAGSTFKNIPIEQVPERWQREFADQVKTDPFPVMPAAWMLSEAGLKGKKIGGAMFAEKHPNFLINLGGASSKDVLALIELAKKTVLEKFSVDIETEIIYLKP